MAIDLSFNTHMLDTMIGGLSILELPKLNVQNLEQACEFVGSYGYDLKSEADEKKLWDIYNRAVTFLRDELLNDGEWIPDAVSDPNELKDLSYLLIYASTSDRRKISLQKWSCAILKIMHVLVHLENDLFAQFSESIQSQIFKSFQDWVVEDPAIGIYLGSPNSSEKIGLKKFETKSMKSSDSSFVKLLAKKDEVAFRILDKMGVRITTKNLIDVFRVMRFLVRKNVINVSNLIPDQSNNTLYPVNLMLEVAGELEEDSNKELTLEDIDKKLQLKLAEKGEKAIYLNKLNVFSGRDYRFVKFIARKRIKVNIETGEQARWFSFFYPFEVQIVDYESYLKNLQGPQSHEAYKLRQKEKARERVISFLNN